MATKPTIALARWADQIGANLVSPSSGLRDLGFQPGTAAVSGFVNTELNELYKWALYLNDGALSGNHTIAGTLATAEALTVGGQPLVFADFTYTADAGTDTLTATAHGRETGDGAARTTNSGGGLPGGLAINTDYFVIRTGADTFKLATSRANALAGIAIDITSNGTGTHTLIDQSGTTRVSDANVTRDLTVSGTITPVGGINAFTAKGLITANAGVTAAANQHVVVSGTGRHKHGTLTHPIPASAFNPVTGSTVTYTKGGLTFAGTNAGGIAPIVLPVGKRITAIRVFVDDNSIGPSVLTATFFSTSSTGSVSDIDTEASSGSGNDQTLTMSGLTTTVAASTSYSLLVQQTSGSSSCTVYMAEVDCDDL